MSQFSAFFKDKKIERSEVEYAATRSLCDENGEPLKWRLRPITTRENERLKEESMSYITTGKNRVETKIKSDLYSAKLLVAAVVYPDLQNPALQDSYGVKTPEDLIKEMIDSPVEYSEFVEFVTNLSDFQTLQDKVDEAKN